MTDWEKLPAGTEYHFQHTFYPVGNLRGGYSWKPMDNPAPADVIPAPPNLDVRNNENKMGKPQKPRQRKNRTMKY